MKAKTALSPRRKKLRLTILLLSGGSILGLVLGIVIFAISRPERYHPGESSADVTSALARGLPAEAPKPIFTDVTDAAGLAAFRTFVGDRTSQLPEDTGPGLAWGDFDNDGDDDLFLVSAGGPLNASANARSSCELHENLGGGKFRRSSAFPELRIIGTGAAWGDCNADGFLDLAVSGYNTLKLFLNEPAAEGRKFTEHPGFGNLSGFWTGLSWGDFNNDRALDLYVCGYVQYLENDADRARGSQQLGTFVPYTLNPASYIPGTNLLFQNRGDGVFDEVAVRLGVSNPEGRSLSALWHDFDDDGWLDLYVANDISDNVFYYNRGGTFSNISHAAWVADYRSAMGLAAGDHDRDGDDDLYITHWVAQENALYDNLFSDQARKNASTMNSNQPPVRFMDIADMKGLGQIALPYVGWGTEFVDFDADGWLDIIVANGNTIEADGPPPRKLKPQELFLFWNQRGQFFHNLAPASPLLSQRHVSRGLAVSDYDNDGDVDFAVADLGAGVRLLRNEMQTGNWLKLRLRSRSQNGQAIEFGDGSKVVAHIGGVVLRRSVTSASYMSQSSRTLHFGLGNAGQVDRLEVRWLAGETNIYAALEANATYELVEAVSTPRRLEPPLPTTTRTQTAAPPSDRKNIVEFWSRQRAAMHAMKVEKDIEKAIGLYRSALELNPLHEDSLYYLGNCLAERDDLDGALKALAELTWVNPQSHRGHMRWGTIRAIAAAGTNDLAEAERALQKAHDLNPEETGALLILGEIALMRKDPVLAEQRLAAACRTNPKAAGGLFLNGYIVWKRGEDAAPFLIKTREALGKDWQPQGATSEGDVKHQHHTEQSPLSRFWQRWNGVAEPSATYAPLDEFLTSRLFAQKG
jgi:tetratricopeptide (TPR) repeat protein